MPRSARKRSESGVYHVVLRGINKQAVFYDDEDREVLLSRLKIAKEKIPYEIYAFCFMSNHVHLLIKEKEKSIGEIMRKILSSYVFWYNGKYERVGNLFQDRFSSEAIEDDIDLLCAARYIHQNSVKAGLARNLAEYKWSSYGAYLSDKDSLVSTRLVLEMLQGKEEYIKFMAEVEERKYIEPTETFRLSDEKLIKAIKKNLGIEEMSDILKYSREELDKKVKKILEIKGTNPYQVSRVTGVTMGVIRSIMA